MNKFVVEKTNGGSMLCMSLEPGNIERLKKGAPILVKLEEMFPNGLPKDLDVYIQYSETPVEDAKKLAEGARVVIDERSKVKKKPHCQECKSTVEQLGVWTGDETPIVLIYCPVCGCVFSAHPKFDIKESTS